jgi:hypothetical protein
VVGIVISERSAHPPLARRLNLEHPSPTGAHKVGEDFVVNRDVPIMDFSRDLVFVREAIERVVKGGG